jgi:hypothetical protein
MEERKYLHKGKYLLLFEKSIFRSEKPIRDGDHIIFEAIPLTKEQRSLA